MHIHTQPAGIEKFFALREFILEVETPEGIREFCRATSSWVIIHGETRRIQKPKPFIEDLLLPETRRVLETTAQKISFDSSKEWGKSTNLRAGYNDIDVHDHVNNGKYLEWFLSDIGRGFFEEKEVTKIELNFLSEVGWGDSLVSQLSFSDGESTYHRVRKILPDHQVGEPAAVGRILWKSRALHLD
jgi:acyl-ACP thioesterase